MEYVNPSRGLAWSSDGDRSVRLPNSASTSGLNCGSVGNAVPSNRTPYTNWNRGDCRHASPR